MSSVPTLEDLGDLSGRRVLLRADFNVPIQDGEITDDLRIKAALPTIRYLLDAGATVTACSHLGRPKGQVNPDFSLDPVRAREAVVAPLAEGLGAHLGPIVFQFPPGAAGRTDFPLSQRVSTGRLA